METYKSSELYHVADCLNIEGGDPYKRLYKDRKNDKFIWANLIVVLDRPLIDNVVFEKIWQDDRYPLLENRIDNLNEHHFMAASLMIIQYYICYGAILLGKNSFTLTVHLHQDNSRYEICDMLERYINHFILIPEDIKIEFLTDNPTFTETKTDYSNTDILISLSQCAGLSPKYKPGTLHIANTFYPFDNEVIYESKQYTVTNDLFQRLPSILKSEFNIESVKFINNNYKSHNPLKKDNLAKEFVDSDFVRSNVLQVEGLWNPVDKEKMILLC